MPLRQASRQDLPAIVALLLEGEPGGVTDAQERAFEEIEADGRNELVVLEERGLVLGYFQITYIPGLGRAGAERALIEDVRIREDRRGDGLGRSMMEEAIRRARSRDCGLVQLTATNVAPTPTGSICPWGFSRATRASG
jgi:GNAT superfamily N-acetyltransferase